MNKNITKVSAKRKGTAKRKPISHKIKKGKIFLEFRQQLHKQFLPEILKLQKAINFDELKEFETDFKKFIEDNQIKELKQFCIELEANILTFNVDNIFSILKDMEKFLVEE